MDPAIFTDLVLFKFEVLEVSMEGRFSEKSDVFCFGVLLLEIVSGRKNSSFQDSESWSILIYVCYTKWLKFLL